MKPPGRGEDFGIVTTDEAVLPVDETVVTTDEAVLTTDDTVVTTDDSVTTTESRERREGGRAERPVTSAVALSALHEELGNLTDADYVRGKTQFRDALLSRFALSDLEAEQLCDELEQAGLLRFVRSERGSGWHIHDPSIEPP